MRRSIFIFLLCFLTIFASLGLCHEKSISNEVNITLKKITPFFYCSISHKGPYSDIAQVISILMYNSRNQNIFPAGPIFGIFHNAPGQTKPADLQWEVGFIVSTPIMARDPLEVKEWNHTLVASTIYVGSYEESEQVYYEIFQWLEENDYTQSGPIMEMFLDVPSETSIAQERKTEIWVPCKKK